MISLCEDLAGAKAKVTAVPVWLLRFARGLLNTFQWARDAADRLVSLCSVDLLHLGLFSLEIATFCIQLCVVAILGPFEQG